jgi:hypothetical protein
LGKESSDYTYSPDVITEKVLGKIKLQVNVTEKFIDDFSQAMAETLKDATAHNDYHFVSTCNDSRHFRKIFVGHIVEKCVEELRENPKFDPTLKNITTILQRVDEELKQEDSFKLDNNKKLLSWREEEASTDMSRHQASIDDEEFSPSLPNQKSSCMSGHGLHWFKKEEDEPPIKKGYIFTCTHNLKDRSSTSIKDGDLSPPLSHGPQLSDDPDEQLTVMGDTSNNNSLDDCPLS